MERAGSKVRSVGTGYLVVQAIHCKASLGSRESTRPTSNGVNFRDSEQIRYIRRFSRSSNCRIDGVSVGRDPVSRPRFCQGREVYRSVLGE